jgi:hypothetical protein
VSMALATVPTMAPTSTVVGEAHLPERAAPRRAPTRHFRPPLA